MIYKSFEKEIQNKSLIFYTPTPLTSVVSINDISFDAPPLWPYKIEADFNGGGFIEVDDNILYNLTSMMDESSDISLRFIFNINESINEINIDFVSAYEFMLGLVKGDVLDNIFNVATTDIIEELESVDDDGYYFMEGPDTPKYSKGVTNILRAITPDKINFWKGVKSGYTALTTKNPNTLYCITDTQEIYLGSISLGNVDELGWADGTANQSVMLTVKGVTKNLSIHGHTHAYVPTSRTINGKALSSNITLTAADIGAVSSDGSGFIRNESSTSSSTVSIDANTIAHNSFKHDYRWKNAAINQISSIIDATYSPDWRTQIQFGHTAVPGMFIRTFTNATTWSEWFRVFHSGNANNTSSAWSASSLSLSGAISGATTGSFSSNVSVGGTLGVTGIATFNNTTDSTAATNGAVVVKGGLGVAKQLRVGTSASIATTLSVGTNASVGGTLGVTGATTLSSTLGVTGATTLTGLLTANGGIATTTVSVKGAGVRNITVESTDANIAGIYLNRTATDANVSWYINNTNGALNFNYKAKSAGAWSNALAFDANGIGTFNNTTDSTAATNGGVVFKGGIGVAKQLRVGTAATIATTLSVGTNATIGGTLGVTGVATFNSTTDSTAATNGGVVIKGGLGVAKQLRVGTSAAIATTLSVGSNTTIGGTLSTTGVATFSSTVTATGNIKTSGAFLLGDDVEVKYNSTNKSVQFVFK